MRRIGKLGLISGSIIVLGLLTADKEFVSGCSSSNKNTETEDKADTEIEVRSYGGHEFKGISCPYGQHECNDGKSCYTNEQKCDRSNDCNDGSDEDFHHCDDEHWPTFQPIDCYLATKESKYTLCFEVNFPGDNKQDFMLLKKVKGAFKTYSGIFKVEPITAVFNYPDTEDGETEGGARFHSMHVGTCSSFSIDTSHMWPFPSTCLKGHPTANAGDMSNDVHDEYAEREQKVAYKGGGTGYKGLDPNGYRVKVKVYYDDAMARVYNERKVKKKLRSVMLYVEEMFHERDTLTTIVQINAETMKIEHARGESWVTRLSNHLGSTLGRLAEKSRDEADLYVFITAEGDHNPLGIAFLGTVCNRERTHRVSINRYGIAGSMDWTGKKNKVQYTAETIAHEMGHNLGMSHDINRKYSDGTNCYGYMDYKDDTNFWSKCSVQDLTEVKKSCLSQADSGGGDEDSGGGRRDDSCKDGYMCKWMPKSECKSNYDAKKDCPNRCNSCGRDIGPPEPRTCSNSAAYAQYCDEFKWACSDVRYPWFSKNCKKTCKACTNNQGRKIDSDSVRFGN